MRHEIETKCSIKFQYIVYSCIYVSMYVYFSVMAKLFCNVTLMGVRLLDLVNVELFYVHIINRGDL